MGLAVILVTNFIDIEFMGDMGTVWLISTTAFIKTLSYCVNAVEAFMDSEELTDLSVVHYGTTFSLLLANSWSRPGFLSVLLFRYVDLLLFAPCESQQSVLMSLKSVLMSLIETSFKTPPNANKMKDFAPTFDNYRLYCVLIPLISSFVLGLVGINNVCPLEDLFDGSCPEIETVDEELAIVYIMSVALHLLLGIITPFIGIYKNISLVHMLTLNTLEIVRLTVTTLTIAVGSLFLHSNQESVFALSLASYACVDALGMFFM